jgi:glycosyltransferase involved in cell wall biosynthesis
VRPKLLWVTAEVPDRNLGGASIRKAYLIEALAQEFEVHLVTIGTVRDSAVGQAVAHLTELPEPAPPTGSGRLSGRLALARWVLTSKEPHDVFTAAHLRAALAPVVDAHLDWADLVHVEHSHLAALVTSSAPGGRPRSAITLNLLYAEVARHARDVSSGRERWRWGIEASKALRFERRLTDRFDVTITVSPEDDAVLNGRTVVVPNGVDLERFTPTPLPAAPRLVFTAHFGYLPNVLGARWFCDEVLPLLRQTVPEASLDLVGRLPTAEVRSLADRPGVRLHADVPDVLPYLQRARVAVVPVQIGSGTRLKALEAMAAARPVVGTSVGLAGLGIEPGRHALVADDPRGLADAITVLLRDHAAAMELAREARKLVEHAFGWPQVAEVMAVALRTALAD